MALVSQGFEASVTLVDSGRNKTTRTFKMDSTVATAADAATAATALLADLVAVTDAVVSGYSIRQVFMEDAFVAPTDGAVQIENQAAINQIINDIPNKSATLYIPAPKDVLFGAPGTKAYNQVILDAPLLLAYLVNFDPSGKFTISDGEKLQAGNPQEGKRIHTKSNKG